MYEDYEGPTAVYTAGQKFPEAKAGDRYVYNGYEYGYNMYATGAGWIIKEDIGGWSVVYVGDEEEPDSPLSYINGEPLLEMGYAFYGNNNLITAPEIPNTVLDMEGTFWDCKSLINAPVIPENVIYMSHVFYNCINLEGNVEINSNSTDYISFFKGTVKPITLTGSSTMLNEIAATGNNGNVIVVQ